MTIYDIPEIVAKALPLAATPTNICSGFRVAGVFPFDREIFEEDEYAPSYTTDRPDPSSTVIESSNEVNEVTEVTDGNVLSIPTANSSFSADR